MTRRPARPNVPPRGNNADSRADSPPSNPRGRRVAPRELLPPDDQQRLHAAANDGTESVKRRAKAMIAWNDGLAASETARRTGLTENQVHYLWRMYKSKGIDLYLVDDEVMSTEKIPAPVAPTLTAPEPEATPTVSIDTLIDQYKIDMKHARQVADLALQLFDLSVDVHRVSESVRPLLEAGAILHNIAVEIDPAKHHTRGRDLIMSTPLAGYNDEEKQMLAVLTAFHRKKVKPEAEPLYNNLPEGLKRPTLALAAILRVADGLDYHGTQQTQMVGFVAQDGAALLTVDGPRAQDDADQALKKADLWQAVFAVPLQIQRQADPTMPARILPEATKVDGRMSLGRAGRIFAGSTLTRLNYVWDNALTGNLTALTSAARESVRLLAALELADLPELRTEAEWLATPTRDALIASTVMARLEGLGYPSNDENSVLQKDLSAALKALDPRRFTKFQAVVSAAILENVPSGQALASHQLGSVLWGKLTELRRVMEFGNSVEEALQCVRQLQDHLVALRDLLGSELAQVMDMLQPLENYLNAISTAQAVIARLEPRPIKRGRGKPVMPEYDPASAELRRAQMELVNMLADGLPGAWNAVNSDTFRRAFGLAIAAT